MRINYIFCFLVALLLLSCENPLEERVAELEDQLEQQANHNESEIDSLNGEIYALTVLLDSLFSITSDQTILTEQQQELVDSLQTQLANLISSLNFITRPQIFFINAPDTLYRPISGLYFFIANCRVYDPDGIEDIQWVSFKSYHTELDSFMNGGNEIYLYDDGGDDIIYQPDITSGDMYTGDGIYSVKIAISSSANVGRYDWIFSSLDYSETYSDTLKQRVVVLESQ